MPSERGASAGIDGDQSDIGAASQDSGAAYVFSRRADNQWIADHYVKASNTDTADNFGRALALSANQLIVTANLEDGGGVGLSPDTINAGNNLVNAGAFYIFR